MGQGLATQPWLARLQGRGVSGPGAIRTRDLPLRRRLLYPLSYGPDV
jgi:hypothetical protein